MHCSLGLASIPVVVTVPVIQVVTDYPLACNQVFRFIFTSVRPPNPIETVGILAHVCDHC